MARALVACGWLGIQTWIGGLALSALMGAIWGGWTGVPGAQFIAFFVFWAIQVAIIMKGIEGIKVFESLAAPLLLAGVVVLLGWALVTRIAGSLPLILILAMVVIAIAQVSTNMAANVVSPSNDFSNLAPRYISFKMGGLITAIVGILSFPWVLFNNVGAYIFTWLVGYGSLLGAIGAVMIMDYWIVRRRQLDLTELYRPDGRYSYSNGWNLKALAAVAIGVVPVIPGFVKAFTTPNFSGTFIQPTFIESLYNYGLFLTFTISAIAYLIMSYLSGGFAAAREGASEPAREDTRDTREAVTE